MTKKILIINPFGVGDVLFSTALIIALKKERFGCYIGYICNMRTKEILQTNPDVDEIFVFERDEHRSLWNKSKIECIKNFFNFWDTIRKRKFDTIFDLSLGKEYAFFCWLAGIKERRGFNYKGRGKFLTHKIPFDGFNDKPVAEYYLDLVGSRLVASPLTRTVRSGGDYCSSEAKGRAENRKLKTVLVPTDSDRIYIDNFLKESGVKEEDILVGIAPGGGISFGKKNQGRRRWSPEKFSELADRIIRKFNAKIVLIWGSEEKDVVKKIVSLMKQNPLVAPKTTIREMAALYKRCKIIICSEGGPLHVASSQGVKTISIFGPVDEKVYGPYPPSEKHTVIKSNIDCRPCYKHFKLPKCDTRKCLEDISVEKVFNAICFQLKEERR